MPWRSKDKKTYDVARLATDVHPAIAGDDTPDAVRHHRVGYSPDGFRKERNGDIVRDSDECILVEKTSGMHVGEGRYGGEIKVEKKPFRIRASDHVRASRVGTTDLSGEDIKNTG